MSRLIDQAEAALSRLIAVAIADEAELDRLGEREQYTYCGGPMEAMRLRREATLTRPRDGELIHPESLVRRMRSARPSADAEVEARWAAVLGSWDAAYQAARRRVENRLAERAGPPSDRGPIMLGSLSQATAMKRWGNE